MHGVAGRSKAPSEGLHLAHLSDDLLHLVLQRTLPSEGLVVTRTALRSRRGHLASSRGTISRSPKRNEAFVTTQWWRDCLAAADVPAELREHPPWSRTREADRLYSSSAIGLPALGVCRRWRDVVVGRNLVRAVVCGGHERPPHSIEVLLLAWPWPAHSDSSDTAARALDHLRELKSLKGLMLWSPVCDASSPDIRRVPLTTEPALPHALTTLRHLVYVNTRGFTRPTSSAAALASLLTQTNLETLGLLKCPSVFPCSAHEHNRAVQQLLCSLPKLRTFFSQFTATLQLQPMPAHPALRHLETHVTFENDDARLLSAQLSRLCALESLRLWHGGDAVANGSLLALTALSRLSHLELGGRRCFTCLRPALLSRLTALSALAALTMWPWDDVAESITPLVTLPNLTALSISAIVEDMDNAAVTALAQLTRLQSLALKIYPEYSDLDDAVVNYLDADRNGSIHGLSTLTCLTALVLRNCNMGHGGCAAIGCMRRLQNLRLTCLRLPDPEALRSLAALKELWVRRCTDVTDAWLASMQLAQSCPCLRGFCLHDSITADTYDVGDRSMAEFTRLRQLDELDLSQTQVTDSGLEQLAALPKLRYVGLNRCPNISTDGLRRLARSANLQCVYLGQPQSSALAATQVPRAECR